MREGSRATSEARRRGPAFATSPRSRLARASLHRLQTISPSPSWVVIPVEELGSHAPATSMTDHRKLGHHGHRPILPSDFSEIAGTLGCCTPSAPPVGPPIWPRRPADLVFCLERQHLKFLCLDSS